MQYANLANEEAIEDKIGDHGGTDVFVAGMRGCKTANDSSGKKDSFWLIALVLTILLIGSVVFFVTHTGGTYRQSYLPTTKTQPTNTTPARLKSIVFSFKSLIFSFQSFIFCLLSFVFSLYLVLSL